MNMEQPLDLLKKYFSNKRSQGELTLNGEDVLQAFDVLYTSLAIPKHTWIEHNGHSRPIILEGWFGMIQFRDGEKRTANLDTLPDRLWIHTEEPEVMSKNSTKRRAEWNNQIVAYYVHEI